MKIIQIMIAGLVLTALFCVTAQVTYVETEGVVLGKDKNSDNYEFKTKGGEVFVMAFDDKRDNYKAIQEMLPKLVDKTCIVKHREGHISLGKTKILLCSEIKEKK
jgi:hypothetical protein